MHFLKENQVQRGRKGTGSYLVTEVGGQIWFSDSRQEKEKKSIISE